LEKAYALWRAFQDKVLANAAALILLGCTLLALLEVVRRYVFGFSYEWQQDAVTFFTLSGVFLFFSVAQRGGHHLAVTLVPELCQVFGKKKLAEVVALLANAFSMVFMAAVVWWGIPELEDSYEYGSRTESLAFPMWPFLAALWVGFIFMLITFFFQMYRGVQRLLGHEVLEEPKETEEEAARRAID
jgi:TRAP-type C4-dicarboxylate transport system permease small subunit